MRCLVTGATGFVGSNLVLELNRNGHEVIPVGNDGEQSLPDFSGKLIKKKFYEINWKEIGKIDAVFHQAAIVGMLSYDGRVLDDRDEFFKVNAEASLRLFEEAISRGCRKIIYASSTAVYGDSKAPYVEGKGEVPNSYYGESKLELDRKAMALAEKYESKDVKIIGLRYCNIYGPRENHKGKSANVIYQFAHQMLKGKPKLFKYGEQKRDETFIDDAIRANLLALEAKKSCVVNCGTGKAVSFNEIIRVLNKVLGLNREIEYIDNPYEFFQSYTKCDMTKARDILGFKAKYNITSGIKRYHESGWLTRSTDS